MNVISPGRFEGSSEKKKSAKISLVWFSQIMAIKPSKALFVAVSGSEYSLLLVLN
jgi:hypothetical protein